MTTAIKQETHKEPLPLYLKKFTDYIHGYKLYKQNKALLYIEGSKKS